MTNYAYNSEPTRAITVRLPESVVERMDSERGEDSRTIWLMKALGAFSILVDADRSVPKDTHKLDTEATEAVLKNPPWAATPRWATSHKHTWVRGTSGLLKCSMCNAVKR